MPINSGDFTSKIRDTFANEQTGIQCANSLTTAIISLWASATAGADGVLQATTAQALLLPQLITAFSGFSPNISVTSNVLSTAIDASFKTIPIFGPTFGTGGITISDAGSLNNNIKNALTNPPTRTIFAQKFASAVITHVQSAKASGSGVPPAIPPTINGSIT